MFVGFKVVVSAGVVVVGNVSEVKEEDDGRGVVLVVVVKDCWW